MRLLLIDPAGRRIQDCGAWPRSDDLAPSALPEYPTEGQFYWLSCERSELETHLPSVQALLHHCGGTTLFEPHVADLLNPHIPSTFDYTSDYDLMVFRRLHSSAPSAPASPSSSAAPPNNANTAATPSTKSIETAPVGFAVFDKLLLSVHPPACPARDAQLQRLLHPTPEKRHAGHLLPPSSADLMLRHMHGMIDGFLELRRSLGKQLDRWQIALLNPHSRFSDWGKVLQVRVGLHQLEEICEDQRAAVQDWIDTLSSWPDAPDTAPDTAPHARRRLELLRVHSRDALEHIERVLHHVRRMEQSAEAAVQLHFSAQSNRANDIMRTFTTLTAIFLPLNLIAAIFGMNFDALPLVHQQGGFWWALAGMALIGCVLLVFFWRRRYLDKDSFQTNKKESIKS